MGHRKPERKLGVAGHFFLEIIKHQVRLFQQTLSVNAHATRPQVHMGNLFINLPNSVTFTPIKSKSQGQMFIVLSPPVVMSIAPIYKICMATHTTFQSCHVSLRF